MGASRARSIFFGFHGVVLFVVGCSQQDTLTVTFEDEIVSAPARSTELLIVGSSRCDETMTTPHADLQRNARIVARRDAQFPVDELRLPDDLPREALAFDVTVHDRDGQQIARGCVDETLEQGSAAHVRVAVWALTTCSFPPASLDISIVVDTSMEASVLDPTHSRLDALIEEVVRADFPSDSRFSLLSFGHEVREHVVDAKTTTAVEEEIRALTSDLDGGPALFDGVFRAAGLARARSVCTHRPVLLVVAGGADKGSGALLQDARVGLYAAVGDARDDIFTVGVGLSRRGRDDLLALVADGVGEAYEALTEGQIANRLDQARFLFTQVLDE